MKTVFTIMRWYFEKFLLVYYRRSLNVKAGSWMTIDRLVPSKWPAQVRSKSFECLWRTKKNQPRESMFAKSNFDKTFTKNENPP